MTPNPKHTAARKLSWITRKERYGVTGMTPSGKRSKARAAANRRAISCERDGISNASKELAETA